MVDGSRGALKAILGLAASAVCSAPAREAGAAMAEAVVAAVAGGVAPLAIAASDA